LDVRKPDGTGKVTVFSDQWPGQGVSACGGSNYFVFASLHSGNSENIWRIDRTGNNLKQVTQGTLDTSPNCSPDGKFMVYNSSEGGKQTVWRIDLEGDAPQQLFNQNSYNPTLSPDGKFVAFTYGEGSGVTFHLKLGSFLQREERHCIPLTFLRAATERFASLQMGKASLSRAWTSKGWPICGCNR